MKSTNPEKTRRMVTEIERCGTTAAFGSVFKFRIIKFQNRTNGFTMTSNENDSANSSPDTLWKKYENVSVKLNVKLIQPDGREEEALPFVLLEGDADSLRYLADLLVAVVNGPSCGFHISPAGSCSKFFEEECKTGIYIHCLPCDEEILRREVEANSEKQNGSGLHPHSKP